MEDILQQRKVPELHRFAQQIQSELFNASSASEGKSAFKGKALIKLVNGLRRRKSQASKQQQRLDRYALPPLYRT